MILGITKKQIINVIVFAFFFNLIFMLIFRQSDLLLWFASLID